MLALTKKTGYGLIAMAHLARLEPRQVASAREIADRFGVPVSLLMNVLKELATGGWVESSRGVYGGYRLARPKEQISVADLINTLEGPIRLTECVAHGDKVSDGAICESVDRCPIADPVHRVQRKLSDFLKSVTLAEIADAKEPVAGRTG
jgi:Rrf2 family protein